MRPPIYTGTIATPRAATSTRRLLQLIRSGLEANPLLHSAAVSALCDDRGGIAKGRRASYRVERITPVGADQTQVLVMDRDRDVVELIGYVLGRAGIDFLAVHDAASALRAFAHQRPFVVVLDPYGLDVLAQLRTSTDGTAIIILTAGEFEDSGSVKSGLGVDHYLTKPFSCSELVMSVRACLRSR